MSGSSGAPKSFTVMGHTFSACYAGNLVVTVLLLLQIEEKQAASQKPNTDKQTEIELKILRSISKLKFNIAKIYFQGPPLIHSVQTH